jgi:hypothetical protein
VCLGSGVSETLGEGVLGRVLVSQHDGWGSAQQLGAFSWSGTSARLTRALKMVCLRYPAGKQGQLLSA